jgi:hypothetical protein
MNGIQQLFVTYGIEKVNSHTMPAGLLLCFHRSQATF